jgi:hypothetical protein
MSKKLIYKGNVTTKFKTSEGTVEIAADGSCNVTSEFAEFLLKNFPLWFALPGAEGQRPVAAQIEENAANHNTDVNVPTLEEVLQRGYNARAAHIIIARQKAFAAGMSVAQADAAGEAAAKAFDAPPEAPAAPVEPSVAVTEPSGPDENRERPETDAEIEARLQKEIDELDKQEAELRAAGVPEIPKKPSATSALKAKSK